MPNCKGRMPIQRPGLLDSAGPAPDPSFVLNHLRCFLRINKTIAKIRTYTCHSCLRISMSHDTKYERPLKARTVSAPSTNTKSSYEGPLPLPLDSRLWQVHNCWPALQPHTASSHCIFLRSSFGNCLAPSRPALNSGLPGRSSSAVGFT